MAIEAEAAQGNHTKVPRRRLLGGARVFREVEVFVRNHPGLQGAEAAELGRMTRDYLEAPRADKRNMLQSLRDTMRQLDGK